MKSIFLSLIFFQFITYSQTFTIEGTVTDKNKYPLAGVNVYLYGENLGSASDQNGFYKISNIHPGNYTLTFSIIGYDTKKINVLIEDVNLELNVSMNPVPVQSDQIIVTAGKYEQRISELHVSADVIPSSDFSKKNVVNIKEALRYTPGVNMVEDQISIRGSSGYSRGAGTRVLTAIDGIPFYTGDTGEIIWEAVPSAQIERVEVIKGAASSLYGSTAIGGVINIITKDIPREPGTYIRTLAGIWDKPSHEQWDWSEDYRTFTGLTLSQSLRFDKLGIALSLTHLNDMGYKQSGFFNRYIGFLKSEYRFSLSSVTLFVNSMNHRAGNFLYWKDSRNAFVPPDADQGQTTKANRFMMGLLYKLLASDNILLNIRSGFYRTHWLDETSSHNTSTSKLYRTEVQVNLSFSENVIFVSGIEGAYSDVRSNIFGNPDSKVAGIYSQADIKFNFPLSASLGVRYDYSKLSSIKSFGDFSPKAGLNYKLTDDLTIRSSFGTGFRAPSLAETFTSTTASGITVKPNPSLLPEKSISAEAGINYQMNQSINLDAAVFNNEYYDFIEASIDPLDQLVYFSNVTRARIQGCEINSLVNLFSESLSISGGYTYLWSRDIQEEKALKYRPRHLVYLSGNYSFFNFQAGADFRYWSRVEEIDDELVSFIRDGGIRVEVYVLDLRAGYNLASHGLPLMIYFNADNVLNYNYVELVGNVAPIRNYSISLELIL